MMVVSWTRLVVLLLVAFGVGVSAAMAAVGKQWEHDSEQYRWLCDVAVRLGKLHERRGYPEAPEIAEPLDTAAERAALLTDCLSTEAECQAFYQRYPDSMSAFYTWLESRNITDRAANDVLVDQLNQITFKPRDVPLVAEDGPTLDEYISQAKARALTRDDPTTRPYAPEWAVLQQAAYDFGSFGY